MFLCRGGGRPRLSSALAVALSKAASSRAAASVSSWPREPSRRPAPLREPPQRSHSRMRGNAASSASRATSAFASASLAPKLRLRHTQRPSRRCWRGPRWSVVRPRPPRPPILLPSVRRPRVQPPRRIVGIAAGGRIFPGGGDLLRVPLCHDADSARASSRSRRAAMPLPPPAGHATVAASSAFVTRRRSLATIFASLAAATPHTDSRHHGRVRPSPAPRRRGGAPPPRLCRILGLRCARQEAQFRYVQSRRVQSAGLGRFARPRSERRNRVQPLRRPALSP